MKKLLFVNLFVVFIYSQLSYGATFVGIQQCQQCHQDQYQAWRGSHHDMSMRHADSQSVLADFNNAQLQDTQGINRFYKKNKQYWVTIKGPDGNFNDYQIKYTFGFEPLQQYMVEFDDGRVQLIPFAWDARDKSQGGQRWFNLYPDMTQKHQEFFWTNTGQNWNYMCADCHSTNVEKNFDVSSNSYQTSFSEINVACEACHGAASEHIAWSKNQTKQPNKGFSRNLTKSVQVWQQTQDFNTLKPKEINHSQQNIMCAQCHSRHVQISDKNHVAANEFGERYMLSLITSPLYYPDGQVYEEDFVYGSFLQSKMNANGVVCSNCHDPHSGKLTMPEEVVCLQCHQSEHYATAKHHHHEENSTGAQCVNCHMPETTYMQIDARRDHGWHIPRPDFAKQFNSPDTCLSCHQERDSHWSDNHVTKWFPKSPVRQADHFAPVFAAADINYPGVAQALSKIAQTKSYPAIIRASALDRMTNIPDTNTLIAIARAAKSKESIIRLGAINGALQLPANERWRIISPLLSDNTLAVRTEAASALAPLWRELSASQQASLQPALSEYIEVQTFNSDRGFAHTNIANIYAHQGKYAQAENAYQQSINIEPYFSTAYINKAELYRLQQNNDKALSTLLLGFKHIPDSAEIGYAIGLAYIRAKQSTKANDYFAKATQFAPNNANYFYVYGISLASSDVLAASKALYNAYQLSNNPQHLYALCDMQLKNRSPQGKQCLAKLSQVAPEAAIQQLKMQYKIN